MCDGTGDCMHSPCPHDPPDTTTYAVACPFCGAGVGVACACDICRDEDSAWAYVESDEEDEEFFVFVYRVHGTDVLYSYRLYAPDEASAEDSARTSAAMKFGGHPSDYWAKACPP